jgi:signal transduction histidine kinase
MRPPAVLGRVPPGGWAAGLWCASTVIELRGYSRIPGMPSGLPPLAHWAGPLLVAATALAITGSVQLRRRPLLALGLLILTSFAVAVAVDDVSIPTMHYLAIDVALGAIVAIRSRWAGVAAFAMTLALLPAYAAFRVLAGLPIRIIYNGSVGGVWQAWQSLALTALVAWLIGNSVRQVRQYARRLSVQAAAQAVTGERLRIARELHDQVAHSIGIIALQAGAAARVIDTQPAGAREAMIAVERTGRETLSGLRRMLGSLRETDPRDADPELRHPAPGLADVDRLAAATTAAGMRVEVRWQGSRRPVPPEVDLSAYRIVQESVTNVVRHAAAARCQVSITYRDTDLVVEITDQGRGGDPTATTGWGLAGMRERVSLLHGEFAAGEVPGGGFRVTARLPMTAGRPAPVAVTGR